MRRWSVLLSLLWLAWPTVTDACPFYRDLVQDVRGNVVTGATVTINVAGTTTLASLYTDQFCTVPATNPTTTASDGTFSVYLPSGYYDVVPAKSGYTFASVPRVQIFEPLGDHIATIADYATTDLTAIGTGALDQIGSTVRTLLINKPALATLDDTCPSTLTLLFLGTGTVTLSAGKTLTLNCRVVNLTEHAVLLGAGTYTKSAVSMGEPLGAVTFAQLGSAVNGTLVYCSDCSYNSNPCSGSSTGAFAKGANSIWRCD